MLRLVLVTAYVFTIVRLADAQTPGVDPRGVMVHSSTVIIGIVEEPWQRVIRLDKIPRANTKVIPQADGTKIVELSPVSRDYMVGYIYHVRVQEVLKRGESIRKNEIVQIFVPESLEGGVSLPTKRRFLLALTRFEPKKDVFSKTTVGRVSEPLTQAGVTFDLTRHYYQVASDRNGAIAITEKNLRLIKEIKSAIRRAR